MRNTFLKCNFLVRIIFKRYRLGIIAKEGSRNAVIMYLGAIIGALNTIVFYPYVMPKEEVGLIMTLTSLSILIAGFSSFGSSASIIKYLPHFRKEDEKNSGGLLGFVVLLCLGLATVITLILILFKDYLQSPFEESASLLIDFYYFLIPLFIINLLIELFGNYANALFKTSFQMFLKEVVIRVGQTILIGAYFFKWINLPSFLIGYLTLYLVSFLLLLIYLFSIGELSFGKVRLLDISKRWEVIRYGGFTFFSTLANSFAFRIDALMLGSMIVVGTSSNGGLGATAIYAVALNMASMIEMPFRALGQIVTPVISYAWKQDDHEKLKEVYTKSTETLIILGVFVFAGIWCCMNEILQILPKEYAEVKWVFLWLGFGKFINVASGANGQILILSPKYYVYTFVTIFGLILTIVTNYIFIDLYQTEGAALATAITYFIINFSMWMYLLLKYRFQPFQRGNVVALLLGLLLSLIFFNLDVGNLWLNLMIKAISISIIYWLVVYFSKLSIDINSLIDKNLKKIRKTSTK